MGIFFFHPQCACAAPFVQHLKDALMLVKEVLPMDEIANILDNISDHHQPKAKVRLLP